MTVGVPVLIVGAGPAGLAASVALTDMHVGSVVVERGPTLVERNHAEHALLASGVGGAGLFSDGKFSFRPAATRLWSLDRPEVLAASEAWCRDQLSAITGAVLPVVCGEPPAGRDCGPSWTSTKRYPVVVLSRDERHGLTERLHRAAGAIATGTQVLRCSWDRVSRRFQCVLNGAERGISTLETRAVIFAAGRFGPTDWPDILPSLPMVYRRVELGLRLEHEGSCGPLKASADRDVKVIYGDSTRALEWRTFCSCRNGEIVGVPWAGLTVCSGRANGEATGKSNFGFNVRFQDSGDGLAAWAEVLATRAHAQQTSSLQTLQLPGLTTASRSRLTSFASSALGQLAGMRLSEGVALLVRQFPDLADSSLVLAGPAIEGVGYYPDVGNSLRVATLPLWVAGDSTGLFRGNTAALTSGYYVGTLCADHLEAKRVA